MHGNDFARLSAAIEARRDELVELTRALIRFPTVNPPGDAYGPCAEFIGARLGARGFKVEYVRAVGSPGDTDSHPRINVVARWDSGIDGPCVHFNGHIDVVPAGAGWSVDPFAGEVHRGRIYGRGSADMKGGLAAAIIAVEALIDAGLELPGAIEISGTADEESGGFGGVHYLAQRGWFSPPRVDHVIIPEPLNVDRVCIGHRGVWWAEIETFGRTAHGSMPFFGDCAVRHMQAVIERFERDLYPEFASRRTAMPVVPEAAQRSTLNLNSIHGGQPEQSAGYPSPCVADSCRLIFDRRLLIEENLAGVKQQMRALRIRRTRRHGRRREGHGAYRMGAARPRAMRRTLRLGSLVARLRAVLSVPRPPDTRRNLLSGSILLAVLLSAGMASAASAKDSLVVGVQLEPPVLDPSVNPAAAIAEMLDGNVYENLVRFRADGGVVPGLAASWEISSDGLVYTFELRHGVKFADGTVFDASTAKFSLERAQGPTNPQRARLGAIESVEALAADRLRIRLERRSGGLLESLALAAFVMVAPPSAGGNALRPVGTGPFCFEAWKRGDSLVLVRNADYWGRPAVLQRIVFRFIADPAAAYGALMAGDVDAFVNYPAPEGIAQFEADPRFHVLVGSSEGETLLGINNRRAPFDDLRVRRAISHALDRRAIIDGAMFGFGTPIGSHFPPTNPAYVDLTGRYPHDLGKARALLAAAGYPRGFDTTLKLPPPAYARRSGEIIASQLASVGIRVTLVNLEWAQWLDQVFARHDFDLSIVAHAEPLDYDIYGRDDYYFGYSSPAFKALLAALDDTVDGTRRRALQGDIQRRLADDAVNGFLFQYPMLAVWNAHVDHLRIDDPQGAIDLAGAEDDALTGGAAAHGGRSGAAPIARIVAASGALGAGLLLLGVARRRGLPYVAGRVASLAVTLLAASAIIFVLVEIVPGDPARYMLGLRADPAVLDALRRQLGLDQPAAQRYAAWLLGALHGDFGLSYTYRIPVGDLIRERLSISVPLALFALTLTVLIAFPAGVWSAARRGQPADAVLSAATQLGLAVPNFWLGLVLVMVFAIDLHWVSAGGFPGWDAGLWPGLAALCLPAVALAAPQAAVLARVLRAALIDALSEDYVRTARAQGAGRWRALYRHALPNALIPVLTVLGLQFSFLLAGGVIIENVFFLPGLGRLVFQAITQRDLFVLQGVVMVLVFAVVMVSFLIDLAYVLVNPRLSVGGAAGALRP